MSRKAKLTPEGLINAVSQHTKVPVGHILNTRMVSTNNRERATVVKYLTVWLLRHDLEMEFPEMMGCMGYGFAASAYKAHRQMEIMREEDAVLRRLSDQMLKTLRKQMEGKVA